MTITTKYNDNYLNRRRLTLTLHLADPEAWLKISFAPGCAWSFTVRITEGGRIISITIGQVDDNDDNDNDSDDDDDDDDNNDDDDNDNDDDDAHYVGQ